MNIYIVVELETNRIEEVFDTSFMSNRKVIELNKKGDKKYIVLTRELTEA